MVIRYSLHQLVIAQGYRFLIIQVFSGLKRCNNFIFCFFFCVGFHFAVVLTVLTTVVCASSLDYSFASSLDSSFWCFILASYYSWFWYVCARWCVLLFLPVLARCLVLAGVFSLFTTQVSTTRFVMVRFMMFVVVWLVLMCCC